MGKGLNSSSLTPYYDLSLDRVVVKLLMTGKSKGFQEPNDILTLCAVWFLEGAYAEVFL